MGAKISKELLISLAIIITITAGTLYEAPPFSSIISFSNYMSEEWEKDYAPPPYSHAELDNLEQFCAKMGIDLQEAKRRLDDALVKYSLSNDLKSVAKDNSISPSELFKIIAKELAQTNDAQDVPQGSGSGIGKKSLEQLCELKELNLTKTLNYLKSINIEAKKSDKFKDIAKNHSISSSELLEMVEQNGK